MATPISIPHIPSGNPPPAAVDACIDALKKWTEQTSERLLELDTKLSGFPNLDKSDHSLAFIIWKSVDDVIKVTADTPNNWKPDQHSQSVRIAFLERPVLGLDGAKLANNTAEAMKIIGALLASAERDADSQQQTVLMGASINDHLATAAPLVKELDMRAAEYAELTEAAAALSPDTPAATIQQLANRAIRLQADLKEAASERERLLVEHRRDPELLHELRVLETRVGAVVAEAREKIANPPKFGLLSVNALGAAPTITALDTAPWPSIRSQLHDRSTKLARAKASLLHVESANAEVLRERHELRQLVDAYRAKAMGARIGEVGAVGVAYANARAVLWSAPCDLVKAREVAAAYQRVVSEEIARLAAMKPVPNPAGSVSGSAGPGAGSASPTPSRPPQVGTGASFPDLTPKKVRLPMNPFDSGNQGSS